MTQTQNLITNNKAIEAADFQISSDTPGVTLHIRNKRPTGSSKFSADQTLLMVHGATYSSESLYDVDLGGFSFMDYLAARGYDVYALDVRGYGKSSRPPEMNEPADKNHPLVRTETAIRDFSSAVDFVLQKQNVSNLNIFAMSWGGTIAAAYTSLHNENVNKLAVLAPQWLSSQPVPIDPGGELGAYRVIPLSKVRAQWLTGVPENKQSDLIPAGWFEQWSQATAAAMNPAAEAQETIQAPTGAILDIREFWTAGKKIYDPSDIKVPVLLVHAEWDRAVSIDLASTYFQQLTGAPYRRWVEIGEGTHLVLLEKNRLQAFEAVHRFFDERFVPEK